MGKIQKILVTGGAGFIGSVLVKRLVDEGYEVTVIDNLSRGSLRNLENYIDKVEFIKHDLKMPIILDSSYDVVFDLAAKIYGITKLYEDEAGFIQDNLRILLSVLEAVKDRTKYYFYISSSCVYNFDGCPIPHKENDAIKIPKAAYDQSKRFAEEIVKIYAGQHGFSYLIIRPFNVYGPGEGEEAPHVVTDFMDRLVDAIRHNKKKFWMLGAGSQTRSFTYVKDLVDALIFLMKRKEKNITINVGTGRETTINELLALLLRVSGAWQFEIEHRPQIPQDVQRRCPDISKIRKLGWRPRCSLEEGLKETWDAKVATIETWDPDFMVNFMKAQTGKVFADVGAYRGYYSEELSKSFEKIYAFEPNPELARVLEARFKNSNVKVVAKAMSNTEGETVLFLPKKRWDEASIVIPFQLQIMVPTSTLDKELMAEEKIDLIKIDVEGAEMQILQGAAKTLKKTEMIVIEGHTLNKMSTVPQVKKILQDNGFNVETKERYVFGKRG